MRSPFITAADLPDTLWETAGQSSGSRGAGKLRLPWLLAEAYRDVLQESGLLAGALNSAPNDEGPQGGVTSEATNEHFARNFSGSCARVEFVAIDPAEVFRTSRDVFVRLFAGGDLHLLDLPCGAGAASATLLCLAAELRQQGRLPRHPLHVAVLGGDLSAPALRIHRRLYRKLIPRLKEFGILVRSAVESWDIEDADQTTALLTRWVKPRPAHAGSAVLAANFSGFLSQKVKDCRDQLREILRHAGIQQAEVLWIEPRTNAATQKLFPALGKEVFPKVPKMRRAWGDKPRAAECLVAHPIQRRSEFTVRAAAMHLSPQGEAT